MEFGTDTCFWDLGAILEQTFLNYEIDKCDHL